MTKSFVLVPPSAEVVAFLESEGLSTNEVSRITIHSRYGDVEINPTFEEVPND